MKRFNGDSTAFVLPPLEEFKDELDVLCSLDQRLTGSLLLTVQNTMQTSLHVSWVHLVPDMHFQIMMLT